MKKIATVVLGASGYTGAELLRLLENHPAFEIVALTGESQAGKPMRAVYPHLRHRALPDLVKHAEVDFTQAELVFCCLPHGTTQTILASLPRHVRIVDLSADFRLVDPAAYAAWYGHAHQAVALQNDAVYGLTEHARDRVKTARLVANPGCYPTCSLLALLPLVRANHIDAQRIVIDALSGISGAGRAPKQEMLFTELDGGVSAYGIGHHRHMAEIEQELSRAHSSPPPLAGGGREGGASHSSTVLSNTPSPLKQGISPVSASPARGEGVTISFTPHLVPMTRGMLATIHAQLQPGITVDDARDTLRTYYQNEYFITVLESGSAGTHQVRGTNRCIISVHQGRLPGELILISVIDNLVKGASGQALQNANLMFDLPETTGLELTAVFP